MTTSRAAVERPTEPKRHRRSHSQLNDYLHCSWAFRLKRIKKFPERPSVWLIGGKAFHSAAEDFDRACWQENDLSPWADPLQWINAFNVRFDEYYEEARENDPWHDESWWRTAGRRTKDKPNGEDLTWWRQAGPEFVTKYVDWRVENNHRLKIAAVADGVPAIEVETDTPLGGVEMASWCDRVLEDTSSGELLLTDIKSGSRTPASPLQLATYAIQLERIFKRPIVWGAWYDARKGQLSEPIDLTRFDHNNLGLIYSSLDRAANEGIFLPRIDSHCKACGVKEFCVFQGGSENNRPEADS